MGSQTVFSEINQYIADNRTQYEKSTNEFLRSAFLNSWVKLVVVGVLALVSLLIYRKSGSPIAFALHSPSILIFLLSPLWLKFFSTRVILDAGFSLIALETLAVTWLYYSVGAMDAIDKTSWSEVIFVLWACNFTRLQILGMVRCISITVGIFLIIFFLVPEYINSHLIGLTTSVVTGLFFNQLLVRGLRVKYYLVDVADSSKLHAFNQLKKIVYPHQLEQIKKGVNLEDTMPVGSEECCVLSFDIVNSSKIDIPNVRSFLNKVMKPCLALLNEGYDSDGLVATGYRIKEMGDGFLCSVGFPFKVPGKSEPSNFALELASKMIQTF